MKKHFIKKYLGLCLIALSLCTTLCVGTAFASTVPDAAEESVCADAVEFLAAKGIVEGADTDFHPEGIVSVSELSAFLGRMSAGERVDNNSDDGDGEASGYVSWAKKEGLLAEDAQGELTIEQINAALSKFCQAHGVEPVAVTAPTRGELAVALVKICDGWLTDVSYTSIVTAYDWGPAINKIVLNLGVEIDPDSVSAEKFAAASLRYADVFDWPTQTLYPGPQLADRPVTAAYVCDESGSKTDKGTYVAVELKVGPGGLENTAGSPLNMDMKEAYSVFIDVEHLISLITPLKTTDGETVNMLPTSGGPVSQSLPDEELGFKEGTCTWTGEEKSVEMCYSFWSPETGAEKGSTPLIIWLHGMGEGGKDPTVAAIGNKVVNLVSPDIQKYFGDTGAALLIPQCPTAWLDLDGTGGGPDNYRDKHPEQGGRSYYTDALKFLIDNWLSDHPEIDTNRIYLGGCSNGGYMTVNMIIEYPGFFAAAFPACEAYMAQWMSDEAVQKIKDTPIWISHAKDDTTVPICEGEGDAAGFTFSKDGEGNMILRDEFSNNLYNRLINAGGKDVHYSLFENVHDTTGLYFQEDGKTPFLYGGHNVWHYVLNNQCVDSIDGREVTIFEWLSQQSK